MHQKILQNPKGGVNEIAITCKLYSFHYMQILALLLYLCSNIKERINMSNIDWETRAKERRLENKELKKRIKELTHSRDAWKDKFMKQKAVNNEMQKKMEIVKKNVQQIIMM
jgi:shikimate kinase